MGSVGSVTSCVSWDDRLKGIERRGGVLQDFRGEGAWPDRFLIGRCWKERDTDFYLFIYLFCYYYFLDSSSKRGFIREKNTKPPQRCGNTHLPADRLRAKERYRFLNVDFLSRLSV